MKLGMIRNACDEAAFQYITEKNLDFIVLNSTRIPGTTFQSDNNQITIISSQGKTSFPKKTKKEVAKDIINELEKLF